MTKIIELIMPIYKDQITERDIEASSGELVRCKDCIHRGDSKKCILAAVAKTKNCPVFLVDNNGEWFCADGKMKDNDD